MTIPSKSGLILALLAFLLVTVPGCVNLNAPTDPTRYYLLNGASDPEVLASNPIDTSPVIRLATVELDPYLDTPYMVLRLQEFEVQFSDLHRWAEDLSTNIRRALARDIMATGAVSDVVLRSSDEADFLVRLRVYRFEGVPPDIAHLSVKWELLDSSGRLLHEVVHDDRNRGWQFENYGHLAEKLDESLDGLALAIASRIRSL